MLTLAFDTSAISASCAICENGKILASSFNNVGLTHSRTMLPMISSLLKNADMSFSDIDRVALTTGPGSFTGLRIGICTAKGLCFEKNIPVCPVSTLLAIAQNFSGFDTLVCSAMDARRDQVYTALFKAGKNKIERLSEDSALSLLKLDELLKSQGSDLPIVFAGDGAKKCFDALGYNLAPERLRFQNAESVALLSESLPTIESMELLPNYLRTPNAQKLKKD